MTSAEHFRDLEEKLVTLLKELPALSDSDRSEVLHFLDVGEYGLALETLVGSMVKDRQVLSSEIVLRIRNLAGLMGLKDSPIYDYLDS